LSILSLICDIVRSLSLFRASVKRPADLRRVANLSHDGTIQRMGVNGGLTRAIEDLLASRQWSQRDLAAAMGKHHSYVNRRMNGEVAWLLEDLESLGQAFGVTPRSLWAKAENLA